MNKAPVGELKTKADLKAVDKVRTFIKDVLDRYRLTEEDRFKVELSLHEITINIVLHAYPRKKGELVVRAWFEKGRAFFEFSDRGVLFDPGEAATPDLREKLKSGKRGGYGVFLYRTFMDGFEYRREAGRNVLTVFKKVPVRAAPRSV